MAYAIVEFEKRISREQSTIVPLNWLKEDFCYWPTGKLALTVQTLMQKGAKINPTDTWEKRKVTVTDVFETYLEASSKLSKPKTYFESGAINNLGRGMRKKIKKRMWPETTSSSDSDETSSQISKPRNQNLARKHKTTSSSDSDDVLDETSSRISNPLNQNLDSLMMVTSNNFAGIPSLNAMSSSQTVEVLENRQSEMLLWDSDMCSNCKRRKTDVNQGATISVPAKGFEKLLKSTKDLKAGQKKILHMLEILMKRNTGAVDADFLKSEAFTRIDAFFPLKSNEDIATMEEFLLEKKHVEEMMKFLGGIGGPTLDKTVKKILKRIISDDCASGFSVFGRKGKMPFSNLKLYTAIIGAVKMNFPESFEVEIVKSLQNWLRHASGRRNSAQIALICKALK